ncbi:MAG: PilZ domain-containing protein [Proteobacteria bacterium]|nr:PilZ domain-containing protein [Pseudomonadota bacterium]
MDIMEEEGRKQDLREVDRKYLVFYLRIYDGMSSKILGHLVDISEKGMMLISDNPISVNENYRLRMRLPTQMKERSEIMFDAMSRWCKSDANPDFFLAGFQIHNLEQSSRDLVLTLIRDFSYNEER